MSFFKRYKKVTIVARNMDFIATSPTTTLWYFPLDSLIIPI
jgi:hypothetical protein